MRTRIKGFTLVELIVVIAVLTILAGITIPRFLDISAMTRGSRIIADLNTCESAVNVYYAQNGFFPENSAALKGSYLATWPKPPQGRALIVKLDKSELVLDVQASNYVYTKPSYSELTISTGRVYLGSRTVFDFLTTDESTMTLVE